MLRLFDWQRACTHYAVRADDRRNRVDVLFRDSFAVPPELHPQPATGIVLRGRTRLLRQGLRLLLVHRINLLQRLFDRPIDRLSHIGHGAACRRVGRVLALHDEQQRSGGDLRPVLLALAGLIDREMVGGGDAS